ncbi:MAG: hypothetical protein ABJE95_26315 [Byssovorax sp.]
MTLKSTLAGTQVALVAFIALVTVAASGSSAIGCGGGDECEIAAAHVVDCVNSVGSPPSAVSTTPAKCQGETACVAACVNQTECVALQDAYGPATSPAAKAFFQCTTACAPQ